MALIEWTDELSVGFTEVDKDHQRLVAIVNELNDAIVRQDDRGDLEEGLEELIEYTSWHFRHEERLMQEHGYDGMEEHQQIHKDLATKAVEIQSKYEEGDDSVLDILMPFLKDWLTEHIKVTDKAMGLFFGRAVLVESRHEKGEDFHPPPTVFLIFDGF